MMEQDVFTLLIAQAWQVAVLGVLACIAVRLFAADRPHLSHAIWALVLIKCMVPPVMSSPVSPFSWIEGRSSQFQSIAQSPMASIEPTRVLIQPRVSVPARRAAPQQTQDHSLVSNAPQSLVLTQSNKPNDLKNASASPNIRKNLNIDTATRMPTWAERATRILPVATVWVWLTGAVIGLIVMIFRFALFLFWLSRSPAVKAAQVEACVEKLRRQLGIRFPVRVKVSARPVGPAVIGVVRPTILLPAAMIESKTDAEIEPLIAHELIHIRRGDLWWAMLQTVVTRLFWFHPLVWLASKMLTCESERCCDEETIAGLGCRPADYARGLLEVLERKHQLRVAPALPGVRPVEITSARLERVMRLRNGIQKRTPLWVWLVMLVCGAIVLPGAAWAVAQEESAKETHSKVGKSETLSAPHAIEAPTREEPKQDDEFREHRFEVGDLLQKIRAIKAVDRSAESILIDELPAQIEFHNHTASGKPVVRPAPPRGARVEGNYLIVNETPEQIKGIQESLNRNRQSEFSRITVETKFFETNQEQIKEFGIEWEQVKSDTLNNAIPSIVYNQSGKQPQFDFPSLDLPSGEGIRAVSYIDRQTPVLFSVATELELQRIIKIANGDRGQGSPMLYSPSVAVFNGQDAEITCVENRPFVTGLTDAEVTGGDHNIQTASYFSF